jgi:hypothetical protein
MILPLTNSLKIRRVSVIIIVIGLSLWGVSAFWQIWSRNTNPYNNFYFIAIWAVGMLILFYSDHLRRLEKKNRNNKVKVSA